METKYFLRITNWNYPKNLLMEEIQQYCMEMKHSLLDQAQRDNFRKHINSKLKSFNQKHSRCKPLEWRYRKEKEGPTFFILDCVYIQLIKCKPFTHEL